MSTTMSRQDLSDSGERVRVPPLAMATGSGDVAAATPAVFTTAAEGGEVSSGARGPKRRKARAMRNLEVEEEEADMGEDDATLDDVMIASFSGVILRGDDDGGDGEGDDAEGDDAVGETEGENVAEGGSSGPVIPLEQELEPHQIIPSHFDNSKDLKLQAQTAEQEEKNRNIPVNTTPTRITQAHIERVRRECQFAPEVKVIIPDPTSRVCHHIERLSFAYTYPFTLGFSLPVHRVIDDFCRAYNLCLAQLGPDVWRVVQCMDWLSTKAGVDFTFQHLISLYFPYFHKAGVVALNNRGKFALLHKSEDHGDRGWSDRYILLETNVLSTEPNFPERWNNTPNKVDIVPPEGLTEWVRAMTGAREHPERTWMKMAADFGWQCKRHGFPNRAINTKKKARRRRKRRRRRRKRGRKPSCNPPNGASAPTPVNLPVAAVAKPTAYTSLGAHGPFPPAAAAANANALAGWMANAAASSSVQAAVVTASSLPVPPNQVSILKRPITPPATLGMVDYQNTDHEQLMKRLRPAPSVEEVTYPTVRQQASWSLDDLPRTVAFTLHQGSSVTSMDFHPSHQTLLLVGSSSGEITLWEVGSREKLVSKAFKIWDIQACTLTFQASAAKDAPFCVNRVAFSPDGTFVGVAFSKHLIHLYATIGRSDLRQHLEMDAHAGSVNDLAFAYPNKQLCIVTCGDDKLIKVWDITGRKLFNFEGHEAPVYSICPHQKENIQFIFSTAIDGKIKAWLYDNMGSRVDYDAPGHWCTTMLYSADGSRLFSCGTGKDGDSYLVEWNESEGAIKRTYTGFRKKSTGVVQFDTTQNHFLAVGEDSQIKFWDMDNNNILTTTDADGGLPSLPRLRFSKEGNLLAVTTADNGIKILANAAGMRSLRTVEAPPFEALRSPIEAAAIKASGSSIQNVGPVSCKVERSSPVRPSPILNGVDSVPRSMEKPSALDDPSDKTKPWQLTEILDQVQCRTVTMPESSDSANKVARLLYTNSGVGVLALGSNGIQKLWKWPRNEQNPTGKATANVVPQHWQPNSGLLMTNDVSGVNLEEAVPCIALSKNDSYVMSAAGGKVSLFNMMTFKVMTTFMPPPPASTFLAFHPQDNNIIAIGMEDSTIHIYNVRVDEVKSKLKGHQKRISGLAFSTNLNILVSSGADAQLCLWSIDSWEKRKSVPIQLPAGKAPSGDTRVQFHSDQVRLLVSHETQLAIYDASKMERIRQWVPQDTLPAPISYAAYSCNSQLIFASFCDGNLGVFDADSLRVRCRIAPSAYLSQAVSNGVYPRVIAAHPQEPNQFAVGLTDGTVKVIEPLESEGKWGVSPPVDNGVLNGRTASSSTTSNHGADQVQR